MASVRAIPSRSSTHRGKNYQVRYRDSSGRQHTKGGFRSRREAEAYAVEVERSRLHGSLIPHGDSKVAFADVATEWLAAIQNRRRLKTVRGYERLLRNHVLPEFGAMRIGAIGYTDVDRFVRALEATGRRPGTVRNVFFVLKMALDYGIKSGRIRVNPCAGVELPSARSPKMLFLTADEVAILATAVGARTVSHRPSPKTRPPFGLVVRFAAYTGLRAGEIVGLRVEDLNFLTRSVHVRRSVSMVEGQPREEAPKTAASGRIVGVPAALWAELVEYVGPRRDDPAGPVFLSHRGGPFNHNVFYLSYFKPAVREALPKRLHGLRFHDLRHTYASLLVEMGAHPKEMAERLGHSSVQITLDRYAHLMPHMDAALTERLDDSYRGAVAKPAAALTEVRG